MLRRKQFVFTLTGSMLLTKYPTMIMITVVEATASAIQVAVKELAVM